MRLQESVLICSGGFISAAALHSDRGWHRGVIDERSSVSLHTDRTTRNMRNATYIAIRSYIAAFFCCAQPHGIVIRSSGAPITYNMSISRYYVYWIGCRTIIHAWGGYLLRALLPRSAPRGAPARTVAFAFAWGVSTALKAGSQRLFIFHVLGGLPSQVNLPSGQLSNRVLVGTY